MIKIFLIVGLISLFGYSISQRRRSFPIALFISLASVAGIVLVINPEFANELAEIVGVGRGADLITYCFILISFFAVFNLHLRLRSSMEIITKLARAQALAGVASKAVERED